MNAKVKPENFSYRKMGNAFVDSRLDDVLSAWTVFFFFFQDLELFSSL